VISISYSTLIVKYSVIDVGTPANPLSPMPGLMSVFKKLWNNQPVECKSTKKMFKLPRPTVTFVDVCASYSQSIVDCAKCAYQTFCPYVVPNIRKTSDGACPILAWMSTPMSSVILFAGPESLGGRGDLAAKFEAAAEAAGKTVPEIADSVYRQVSGNIKKVAGLPDAYDYEFEPQEVRYFRYSYCEERISLSCRMCSLFRLP
jgi:hypothetical protein